VEIEYRNGLRDRGVITFLGGKQEFIRLGEMDDVDMMIMQHSAVTEKDGTLAAGSYGSNGFSAKLVKYIGKAAHAGGEPHLGINALNAASLGLQAVAMQRETFQDKDSIRVHPIITKGGNLVNVVPEDVRIETYIRGNNVPAIVDADFKVCRAFRAGGDAVGAQTVIVDLPGYMPMHLDDGITQVAYDNIVEVIGDKDKVRFYDPHSTGSLDAGDVSQIMPVAHMSFKCVEGVFHSSNFEIPDKETAYITPAKVMAMAAIDLLYDGAAKALEVKANFKPQMTKDEYLRVWGKLE
jgi:metal-dependent amidase/aminoacylase/carboxypeptidase family protein